jgi:hypothetical protein
MAKSVLVSEGNLIDEDGHPVAPGLSAQQTIALWATPKVSVGVWTPDFTTLAPSNLSDGVQNSSISFDFISSSGTYALDFMHLVGPNRGIYTIAIDGVTVGTVDAYAAAYVTVAGASIGAAGVSTLTGIGLSPGAHVLKFTMATKNASSSAYYGCISGATFTRRG